MAVQSGAASTAAGIERILERIRGQMTLDRQTETEVLDEIRSHLEELVAEGRERGLSLEQALAEAAARFGVEEVGAGLQQAYAGWGTADGVLAAALPVLCALVLRWLAYAPDGTALGWPELLARPSLWVVAGVVLLVPLIRFRRWRFALTAWLIFWVMTVIALLWPGYRW